MNADLASGRFAPTPSGPLHLGSLYTALASWLDARSRGARWHLRIDDLDAPRCDPAAADTIARQLEAHALHWDGEIRFQSAHQAAYHAALDELRRQGRVYACHCTRRELRRLSQPGPDGAVYPGLCRDRGLPERDAALRLRVDRASVTIVDRLHGAIVRDAEPDIGDFIVRRRDGQIGYQLACVVDDEALAIGRIVRGYDLIGSSLRQRLLIDLLGHAAPEYLHVPVLADRNGKLSKQHHAAPIANHAACENLRWCLRALGQAPVDGDTPAEMLAQATRQWQPDAIPRSTALRINTDGIRSPTGL